MLVIIAIMIIITFNFTHAFKLWELNYMLDEK